MNQQPRSASDVSLSSVNIRHQRDRLLLATSAMALSALYAQPGFAAEPTLSIEEAGAVVVNDEIVMGDPVLEITANGVTFTNNGTLLTDLLGDEFGLGEIAIIDDVFGTTIVNNGALIGRGAIVNGISLSDEPDLEVFDEQSRAETGEIISYLLGLSGRPTTSIINAGEIEASGVGIDIDDAFSDVVIRNDGSIAVNSEFAESVTAVEVSAGGGDLIVENSGTIVSENRRSAGLDVYYDGRLEGDLIELAQDGTFADLGLDVDALVERGYLNDRDIEVVNRAGGSITVGTTGIYFDFDNSLENLDEEAQAELAEILAGRRVNITIRVANEAGASIVTHGDVLPLEPIAAGILFFGSGANEPDAFTTITTEVRNDGTIETSGDIVRGISVRNTEGTIVENTGSITTGGLRAYGIEAASSNNVTITNEGDVNTTGEVSFGIALGDLEFFDDGQGGTITTGEETNNSLVVNTGRITTSGLAAHGVNLRAGSGNEVRNSGEILTSGQVAAGVLINTDSVPGTGNSVSNMETGQIIASGEGSSGVLFLSQEGSENTLRNEGLIRGAAYSVGGGDGVENVFNTGQLEGDVDLGGGNDRLDNRGAIFGGVNLGAGNDDLLLFAGQDIVGLIDGGEGNDRILIGGENNQGTAVFELDVTGIEFLQASIDSTLRFSESSTIELVDITGGARVDLDEGQFSNSTVRIFDDSEVRIVNGFTITNDELRAAVELDGASRLLIDTTLTNTGDGAPVIFAYDAEGLDIRNIGTLASEGEFSNGITLLNGNDGSISNEGTITTAGLRGYGVELASGEGHSVSNSGTIETSGVAGFGVSVGRLLFTLDDAGEEVTIANATNNSLVSNTGSIITTGASAHGINIRAGSNNEVRNDGEIRVEGENAVGVLVVSEFAGSQNNSIINREGATISATSDTSIGVFFDSLEGLSNTLDNSGTIQGGAFAVAGLDGNERIINSGTLQGAVALFGGNDFIQNSGTINGDIDLGAGDDDLELFAGGALDGRIIGGEGNDRIFISPAGDAEAFFYSIDAEGIEELSASASGTLRLAEGTSIGTVNITNTGDVFIDQGNFINTNLRVFDSAQLSLFEGAEIGRDGIGAAVVLSDSGSVASGAAISTTGDFAFGIAAVNTAGSQISNQGSITTDGDFSTAINVFDSVGVSVDNSGTIDTQGMAASGIALTLSTGGTALNIGAIAVAGDEATGVLVSGADNSVENREGGTISATGAGGVGVFFTSEEGQDNRLLNGGMIDAVEVAVAGNAGNEFVENTGTVNGDVNLNAGNDFVRNAGTINGDVNLGTGDDEFEIIAGGVVNGTVDGGEGRDRLTLTSNDAVGDQVVDGSNFINFESLFQNSGGQIELVFSGDVTFESVGVSNGATLTFDNGDFSDVDLEVGDEGNLELSAEVTSTDEGDNGVAVAVTGAGGTLATAATVTTTGAGATTVAVTGANSSVANSGMLMASGNDSVAVAVMADGARLMNNGMIATTGQNSVAVMAMANNANVTNAEGRTISTAGVNSAAIMAMGSGSTLANDGTVVTEGDNSAGLVVVGDGNMITNTSNQTIRTSGIGSDGLVIEGTGNQAVNTGTITVTGADSVGVRFITAAGDVNSLNNTGTINSEGVAILGGDGDETVTNSGVVNGDILLGAGDDVLNWVFGASASGIVDGGDGFDMFSFETAMADETIDLDLNDMDLGLGFEAVRFNSDANLTLGGAYDAAAAGVEMIVFGADTSATINGGNLVLSKIMQEAGSSLTLGADLSAVSNVTDGVFITLDDESAFTNMGDLSTTGDNATAIGGSFINDVTLINAGTISTTGTGSDAVAFVQSQNLAVTNSGTITTTGNSSRGFDFGGGSNITFTNTQTGVITASGQSSNGVRTTDVTGATIVNHGMISTFSEALIITRGTDQTITNTATGHISTTGVSASAIRVSGGSTNTTVANAGEISTSGDAGHAISVTDAMTATVTNTGTLATTGSSASGIRIADGNDVHAVNEETGAITTSGNTAYGVLIERAVDSSFTNAGSVTTASANADGIRINGGEGLSVDNTGAITTMGGAANAIDVDGLEGSSITNAGMISTAGASASAVRVANATGITLTNTQSGSITATGVDAVAIDFNSLGSNNNMLVNHGTINSEGRAVVGGDGAEWAMNAASGVIDGHVVLGGGDDVVMNAGAIDGNVLLGAGDDSFLLAETGSVTGMIDGGDGTDVAELRFAEDAVIDGAFLSRVVNFETVNKFGGNGIDLSSNATFVDFGVNEGLFAVNAVLTSNLTVGANGTLGGAGTIVGDVVVSGTLSPGNSIDTLTIDGNLVLDAASVFEVEFNRTGADRVLVTGTADLQGGTLLLTPEGNDVFGVFSYEVLRADGGITGDFGTQVAPNFALLTRRYVGNSLFLDIITQLGAGVDLDPQSEAVADYLNGRLVAGASASTLAVFTDLAQLNPTTQLNGALAQLHGEAYAASSSLTTTTTLSVVDALDVHGIGARQIEAGHYGLWATALSEFGDQDGQGGTSGFDSEAYGAMVGFDYGIADGVTLGALVGYQSVDQDFDTLASDTEGDNVFFGAYAAAKFGGLNVDASFVYHTSDTETTRSLSALGLNARADYDVDAIVLRGRLGYDVSLGNGYTLEPYAGLAYIESDRDDIVETGAEGASLLVNGGTTDFTFLDLGARFTGEWGDKTRAHFNAAWRTDLSDDANVATARFVDESVGFTIAGAQIDDSRALFGVGVNHQLTKRLSLYVDYDGEFASDLNSHALRGGLRFGF